MLDPEYLRDPGLQAGVDYGIESVERTRPLAGSEYLRGPAFGGSEKGCY